MASAVSSRPKSTARKSSRVVAGGVDREGSVGEMDNDNGVDGLDNDGDEISFCLTMQWYLYNICSYDFFQDSVVYLFDVASFRVRFDHIMLCLTIVVLGAEPIKTLVDGPMSVDHALDVLYIICIFIFLFEWVASTLAKTAIHVHWSGDLTIERSIIKAAGVREWFRDLYKHSYWSGYFLSLPWLFDAAFIVLTASNISWVQQHIYGSAHFSQGAVNIAIGAPRIVRIIKWIQVTRRNVEQDKQERQDRQLMGILRYSDVDPDEFMAYVRSLSLSAARESKLGNQLKEFLVRRIILIVYGLFFVLPVLVWQPEDTGGAVATSALFDMVANAAVSDGAKAAFAAAYIKNINQVYGANALLYLRVSPPVGGQTLLVPGDRLSQVRAFLQWPIEYGAFGNGSAAQHHTKAVLDLTHQYKVTCMHQLILYATLVVVLAGSFVVFINDIQRLVLAPIERMMNMVDEVSRNPLQKLHFDHDSQQGEYEMNLLESTLEKVTSLLRIGFGEAGANIIKTNLNNADDGCTINPLLPGIRIYAIVGFCDIHQFEYCTQQLGNDVLRFVNAIAEIVHSNVHSWRGACNKNLGNAFVLLWRIGDEEELLASYGARSRRPAADWEASKRGASVSGDVEVRKKKEVDLRRVPDVERWADHALISYLKIIVDVNRNKRITDYRVEPRLTMDGARDFKVRMGFGLHAGWAIEGAVGSRQKVDATYLSPHVNMAARLETSSRQYGVPLLMSQNFYELLSDEGKELCRRVDRVTVKGSEVPIDIYTYDCLQDQEFRPEKKTADNAAKDKMFKMLGMAADSAGPDFSLGALASSGPFGVGVGVGGRGSVQQIVSAGLGRGMAPSFKKAPQRPSKRGSGSFLLGLARGTRSSGKAIVAQSAASLDEQAAATGASQHAAEAAAAIERALQDVQARFTPPIGPVNGGGAGYGPAPLLDAAAAAAAAAKAPASSDAASTSSVHGRGSVLPSVATGGGAGPSATAGMVVEEVDGSSLQSSGKLPAVPSLNTIDELAVAGRSDPTATAVVRRTSTEAADGARSSARIRHGPPRTSGRVASVTSRLRVLSRPSSPRGDLTAIAGRKKESAAFFTFTADSETALVFERDPDLFQLRAHVTKPFLAQFNAGLALYLAGNWSDARRELETANEMMKEAAPALGGDGPSLALLRYMDQGDYAAPSTWMNYRPLTSK